MQNAKLISAFADSHREEYLEDLDMLVRIPSVSEELYGACEDAPFGTRAVDCLNAMLDLCERSGLRTRRIGNVIGMAEYGEGERELDIVAHLDVQPAGTGWTKEPFRLTVEGDTAYGRGASDDKGPALAALYAVRALKESGISLSKRVRLVFGTGEEYAIQDMHYYTDAETPPPFMFTPDHSYPIVNGRKGSYTATLGALFEEEAARGVTVESVTAGDNRGAVPGLATAVLRGADMATVKLFAERVSQETGLPFEASEKDGKILLSCTGVSTHAVKADMGKSALTAMLELVCSFDLSDTASHRALRAFSHMFPHGDVSCEKSELCFSDELSGKTLYNIGIFRFDAAHLEAKLRATLPVSVTEEGLRAAFHMVAGDAGLTVSEESFTQGRMIPLDDPYIEKLLQSYELHSGKKAFGIAAGGGDYSTHFPHGVAFGCEPFGVDTRMHGADEYVSIDNMLMSIKIFAQSIYEICK